MKWSGWTVAAAYSLGVAVAHPSDRLSLGWLLVAALLIIAGELWDRSKPGRRDRP